MKLLSNLQRARPARPLTRTLAPWLASMAAAAAIGLGLPGAAAAADLKLQLANLDNPYFPDRAPDAQPRPGEGYRLAPAPAKGLAIEGDRLSLGFTLVSSEAQRVTLSAQWVQRGTAVDAGKQPMRLYRALDVQVEGNSNGNCSCPAGQLPQTAADVPTGVTCVASAKAVESLTPSACPTAPQREKIAGTLVRAAPFAIKDALEPLGDAPARAVELRAGQTELFVLDAPVTAALPKGALELRVNVRSEDGRTDRQATWPVQVMRQKLDGFPTADLSYWISEDPRDLVARPEGTPLNGRWGGEWWSEEHWKHLQQVAELQADLGVTSGLVPLFVRSPFGIDSRSLVKVKCITGSADSPKDFSPSSAAGGSPFNTAIATWDYDFDFTQFDRWIGTFKRAGFRQFEGAHLLANGGQMPVLLECDLYRSRTDATPYARNFRFMPRAGAAGEEERQKAFRVGLYRDKFLPRFLPALSAELKRLGVTGQYVQHIIDENAPTDAALDAYASMVAMVRTHLPGVRTMDAINQFTAPKYAKLIDLPVFHLALVYEDQLKQKSIRKTLAEDFPGRKYFYNTALREGGPNRFTDTNPLESRAYGWQLLELGYNGMLYWAANFYRYPTARDLSPFNRAEDWSPLRNALGPLPNGFVSPGLAPGSNWVLYPGKDGLMDSLRARRLRAGLLDHWLYLKAWNKCQQTGEKGGCTDKLLSLRRRISGDFEALADYSRQAADYDDARLVMAGILEP